MKRSRCRTSHIMTAFGIGVLLSLICPSDLLLIVTLIALILLAVCGLR